MIVWLVSKEHSEYDDYRYYPMQIYSSLRTAMHFIHNAVEGAVVNWNQHPVGTVHARYPIKWRVHSQGARCDVTYVTKYNTWEGENEYTYEYTYTITSYELKDADDA